MNILTLQLDAMFSGIDLSQMTVPHGLKLGQHVTEFVTVLGILFHQFDFFSPVFCMLLACVVFDDGVMFYLMIARSHFLVVYCRYVMLMTIVPGWLAG